MSALKSIGSKVTTTLIVAGLAAGAAFAATGKTVTVKLPEAVTLGGTTLAGGEYTITESSMNDGSSLFIFRSDKGASVAAVGMRNIAPAADQKTEVVLANDGGALRLDKMFIEGDAAGYRFASK